MVSILIKALTVSELWSGYGFHTNQSAAGAQDLGIIRGKKVGESE